MEGEGVRRVEWRRFRAVVLAVVFAVAFVFGVAVARDLFVVTETFVARGARRASALAAAFCAALRLFAALPLSL